MKLALDPYMFRSTPLLELPRLVAELQGEVDFDELFASLAATGFNGTVTTCVFAWEERARESSTFMRDKITELMTRQGMHL